MKELTSFIEKNLNRERLADISSAVIDAYKKEDDFSLKNFASVLRIEENSGNRKKLFYRIIKRLHPDRFPIIKKEFETAKSSSNRETLEMIKELLQLIVTASAKKAERFEYEHTETYYNDIEFDSGVDIEDVYVAAGGFLGAVQAVIYGSHNFYPDPADLGQIDGSLDISGFSIDELDGIEYCRNVTILDISDNDISNIYDLQFLTGLEELYAAGNTIRDIDALEELGRLEIVDLSGNDIEDISPLLKIEKLKFVDIRKNPVRDSSIIDALKEKGVVVIY